ncbi:MAG: hypothetical protein QXY52_05540 [Conexivisphaerales archaeon]
MIGRKVALIGASMTRFGNLPEMDLLKLMVEPSLAAMDLSKIDLKGVGAIFVSNMLGDALSKQTSLGTALSDALGVYGIPAERIENGPAGASALRYAYLSVSSGESNIALVTGVEKMRVASTDVVTDYISSMSHPYAEYPSGATMPSLAGMFARLYMNKYGVKPEHMGMVAVKNHDNALKNPYAHLKKKITLDYLFGKDAATNNPFVADPIRLYDVAPISDGGAALVVADLETAKQYTDKPVIIEGYGEATDRLAVHEREDPTELRAVRVASQRAMEMAGVTPQDIDVAELHDAFTILEIAESEDVGFFKKGEGHLALERGDTSIGGKIPINTSGGHKARGHPVGASGIAQIVEIYWQLRGEAFGRQVEGAKLGLTVNLGGFGSNAVSFVFRRA